MTNDQRKSDSLVVPTKLPNRTYAVAEAMEGRRLAKGNANQENALRTQLPGTARQVTLNAYDMPLEHREQSLFVMTMSALLVTTQGKSPVR